MDGGKEIVVKIFKILAVFMFVIFGFVLTFWFISQKVMDDGFALVDRYCIDVNPTIIARKNSYSKFIETMKASASAEDQVKASDENINDLRKNYETEKAWLIEGKNFYQRWDYKLFGIPETKRAAEVKYQLISLENDMSKAILDYYNGPGEESRGADMFQDMVEKTKRRAQLEGDYEKAVDGVMNSKDLRYRLLRVPASKCPDENWQIPEVPDIFAPKAPNILSPSNPSSAT